MGKKSSPNSIILANEYAVSCNEQERKKLSLLHCLFSEATYAFCFSE